MRSRGIATGQWNCAHTTDFIRCNKCNLIFCGYCHQVLVRKRAAANKVSIASCPDCGDVNLVDITPGRGSLQPTAFVA